MTANRLEGYNFVSNSYQDLYEFTDEVIVQGFDTHAPDQLAVQIAAKDGPLPPDTAKNEPEGTLLTLLEGLHPQSLNAINTKNTPAFWTMWGEKISPILIGNVNVPIGRPVFNLNDFVAPASTFPQAQVEKARHIAFKEFGVRKNDPSVDILRSLAIGLHQSLYPHRGDPHPGMRRLNGFLQYKEALAHKSGVYCENHAEIFAFFANAVGIPTRVVGAAGRYDGIALGAHAFVESFIQETGRWMYIDLQLNIFGVTDEASGYLSAADFVHRMASKSAGPLKLEELQGDGTTWITFADRSDQIGMFLHPKVTLVYLWGLTERYHPLERIKRFLIRPQPGYSLRHIGIGTELRILCTYIFLGLSFFWGILRLRHMRS